MLVELDQSWAYEYQASSILCFFELLMNLGSGKLCKVYQGPVDNIPFLGFCTGGILHPKVTKLDIVGSSGVQNGESGSGKWYTTLIVEFLVTNSADLGDPTCMRLFP